MDISPLRTGLKSPVPISGTWQREITFGWVITRGIYISYLVYERAFYLFEDISYSYQVFYTPTRSPSFQNVLRIKILISMKTDVAHCGCMVNSLKVGRWVGGGGSGGSSSMPLYFLIGLIRPAQILTVGPMWKVGHYFHFLPWRREYFGTRWWFSFPKFWKRETLQGILDQGEK